ncbi:PAS domain-containing sensor histidine kinase [Arcobacter roscoffensis]|uniref:histidine kinase n=1 Tax=Arcobacter roscoffensis TaxID=2961520 RepID=A0ABY5E3R5_9BACT|nr:PAS domain-containing sensor histidine kinase [Arcobacter roscoffensis]UTJ06502.1 PAS domain-containing sensor histidine kinase [Arcobacter roscoffensis]
MKKFKLSLYFALAITIISTVVLTMSINSTYSYMSTKDKIIHNMKNDSKTTILSIKDNIKNLISAYAINEYNNLIYNELSRKDIFAIIINDYNMGKILGEEFLSSGKIKQNGKIIDYDPTNLKHNQELQGAFYSDTYKIVSSFGTEIGTISIYITDEKMNKELKEIIIENIKNTFILSLFLILFLFLTIKAFILKPIADITKTVSVVDKNGIPTKLLEDNTFIEIDNLSSSINKMINTIKKSTDVLKNEQNKLEYLLQNSPIAVRIAKDNSEDVVFANHAYKKLIKKDNDFRKPKNYYENKKEYNEILEKLKNNETIYNKLIELNIDNKRVWALASYMNIDFDNENAVIGWFYDVTNEKNSENRLYEALELQTTIFDNSGYMITRTDKKGIIKQVNKEVEKTTGYTQEELIDKQTPLIFHLEDELNMMAEEFSKKLREKIEPNFNIFIAKSALRHNELEWTYKTKDGKHIPVSLNVTALKNKNNEIYGYLGISRDISQNKVMESQSKLASMGEMIGNIAHQWRQPLSVITSISSATILKSEVNKLDKEDLYKSMENITKQAKYLSNTIEDFRDFIRNKEQKDIVKISQLVNKTINIIKSTLSSNEIELVLNIKEDMEIPAFENQLIQGLINIINNSKDAMNEHIKKHEKKLIFIETQETPTGLDLIIVDNGGGIKKDILNKIFEPYFTTKHKNIGTGIGLSMTYQIITDHHDAKIIASNSTYVHNDIEYTGAKFKISFNN